MTTLMNRNWFVLFAVAVLVPAVAEANTLSFNGLTHTSTGAAVLAPSGANLVVSNIGSSGLDGVSVDIDPAGLYEMDWLPLDPLNVTPDVELLKIKARGRMGGGAVQDLGYSTLTRTTAGTKFEITADYGAAGSATYGVALYLGGGLVYTQNGITEPVAQTLFKK